MKTVAWGSLAAAVLMLGVLLPHAQAAKPPAEAEPVLVGVEDDCAPFAWVGDDGQPRGYAVDVVRQAFSEMKVPMKLVVLPFERCMREARQGRVAACFNSMFNEDAAKEFHLHEVPLFHEPLGVLALASAPRAEVDPQTLQGRTVGYVQSYQYPEWFMNSTTITRVPARSDKALLLMLARQRVDFALYGPTMAAWHLQTTPELQALYEYQSMMASLMALDVTNASLYDGASALAEAVLMAVRAHRTARRVLMPRSVDPAYRKVVRTIDEATNTIYNCD